MSVFHCVCVCGENLRLMVLVPQGGETESLSLLCPLGGNGRCWSIRDKCFHSGPQIVSEPGYGSADTR